MRHKSWVFQEAKQIAKLGADGATWFCGWYDPAGKRRCKACGVGREGKRLAKELMKKRHAELVVGSYQVAERVYWAKFREKYEATILPRMRPRSQIEVKNAFKHFEKICKPGKMSGITREAIDQYVTVRMEERGKVPGDKVSPHSVRKELATLKAAFNVAIEWEMLDRPIKFPKLRMPEQNPTTIPDVHFWAIYDGAKAAEKPERVPYPTADWWKALLTFGVFTGWRISDILAFRWADVDLESGRITTRVESSKAKREDVDFLIPDVIDHLKRIQTLDEKVFPWESFMGKPLHHRRTIDVEFHRIQEAAGIKLHCAEAHEHTDACHRYGFHDLKRTCLTRNADRLSAFALTRKARHRSISTTQRYLSRTETAAKEASEKSFFPVRAAEKLVKTAQEG